MSPAQFEPIGKDLLEAACAKLNLTEDFIEKVKKSNTKTAAESSTYNTDYDTIRQGFNVRLQWKPRPFGVWVEYLDPIRKSSHHASL